MDATIFDMSPNVAFGFRLLMADCAFRKNSEYADTGLEARTSDRFRNRQNIKSISKKPTGTKSFNYWYWLMTLKVSINMH